MKCPSLAHVTAQSQDQKPIGQIEPRQLPWNRTKFVLPYYADCVLSTALSARTHTLGPIESQRLRDCGGWWCLYGQLAAGIVGIMEGDLNNGCLSRTLEFPFPSPILPFALEVRERGKRRKNDSRTKTSSQAYILKPASRASLPSSLSTISSPGDPQPNPRIPRTLEPPSWLHPTYLS